MIEPTQKLEYKFLRFSTHEKAQEGLNQYTADGWQFVSYQAAGDSGAVTHFIVVCKETRNEPRRFGFG